MRNIQIPDTVEAYQEDVLERAFPEPLITEHPFYKNMIGWVIDNRTPLLYEQDHDDEYTNLSINFNWLLLRDYEQTKLGPPNTIAAMYGLHEFAHMTHWLPTRLDEMTAGEYAEQFTRSEYRASNETEVLIHYRIPELRSMVFDGMRIAVDVMKDKGMEQPTAAQLANVRPLLVEDTILDGFFGDTPEDQEIAARFKRYNGNRQWATERFAVIQPHFQDRSFPQGSGLTTEEYEAVIASYQPHLSQELYERNVIRNIKFGYAMCGEVVPELESFEDACKAAKDLEGHHAIVQS